MLVYLYSCTGTYLCIPNIAYLYKYAYKHAPARARENGTRTAGAPPTDTDLNKRPGQSADRIGKTAAAFPRLPRTPVLAVARADGRLSAPGPREPRNTRVSGLQRYR